ncbi:MAG: dipeptide epimerase [Rhizobiales bacterium]|nr:dipeptide epimerase [Hyphomicrobiales bacterium]
MTRQFTVAHESWPIAGSFTISRGTKTSAEVVTVTLEDDGATGRGECVPYPRYGETVEAVKAALERARPAIEAGMTRRDIPGVLDLRAARNAVDCALWDLEAKKSGTPVWQLAGLPPPQPTVTAYTLSLDTPHAMAEAARNSCNRPLLKLKLGDEGDAERLRAIRAAAPSARLIIDANEGWQPQDLEKLFSVCEETGVELIEQPLPAGNDDALRDIAHPVMVCADESAHDRAGLNDLIGKYDAINIKLDKTGGLTEMLATAEAAREAGLDIMIGCMLATSLAMAPALIAAANASFVDLDGPLLLARDRQPGITFDGSIMQPPPTALWG